MDDTNLPYRQPDFVQHATCLFDEKMLHQAMNKLAIKITAELHDKDPIVLCIMLGGIVFTGQLLPRLQFPLTLDYVHATRYQGGEIGNKEMVWFAHPRVSLRNRTVLILDDVLDGGVTLQAIIDECQTLGATKVYTAVLVDKPHKRESTGLQKADFVALETGDYFLFGYGMDYVEYWRNAPGIYKV